MPISKTCEQIRPARVSAASRVTQLSLNTQGPGVSDFLDATIEELDVEKVYLYSFKNGPLEAHQRGILSEAAFQDQMRPGTIEY